MNHDGTVHQKKEGKKKKDSKDDIDKPNNYQRR